MYKTNVTDDYDNFTSNNMTLSNCMKNEKNFDKVIPTILLTLPSGLSILCSMRLMV